MFSPRCARIAAAGAVGASALSWGMLFGAPMAQAAPPVTSVATVGPHVVPVGGGHGGRGPGYGHGPGHGGYGHGGYGHGGWGQGGYGHGGWGHGWGGGDWGHRPWWLWW